MTSAGPGEREEAIDALRGLCLLGIAIVNVPWIGFAHVLPLQLGLHFEGRQAMAMPDLIAAIAVEWLAEGKFYPQFSALFGFGAGVLMARGMAIYARRIAVLFVFGVLHSIFGWWGDILLNYALMGALLALLSRASARTTLIVAIACYVGATAISLLFDGWFEPAGDALRTGLERGVQSTATYRDGTFATITMHRIEELYAFFAQWEWSYRANTVAMGAFGLFVHKSGFLRELREKRATLGRIAAACLVVGLPCAVIPQGYIPAGDVVAIGYACLFLWLASRGAIDGAIRVLVPLGRCAISGYLGQTVAFTLFFYGYGLAMYGRLSAWQGVVLALVVWIIEVMLARAWMARFALGPVEWLWRSITYLRVLPMRR
jgi:uncharacterized protein